MYQRRVRRPKQYEEEYKDLTNKDEFGFFKSYKDVFMAAALIGYINDHSETIEKDAEPMAWNVFNLDTDEPMMDVIAFSKTQDETILIKDEENFKRKIAIIEEYAAGGVQSLHHEVFSSNKRFSVENYFQFLMSYQDVESPKENLERKLGNLF